MTVRVSIKCDDKVREKEKKKKKKRRERVREIKQARERKRQYENTANLIIRNFIYLQLANILMQYVQCVDNSTFK